MDSLFCAPLADITTPVLRSLIRKFNTRVILHTEMLSAGALLRGGFLNASKSNLHMFDTPIAYQLLGNNACELSSAAKILSSYAPYAIDLNLGCSAPDIRKKNMGSYLLQDIELVSKIINSLRPVCKTKLSVKMRAGILSIDEELVQKFLIRFKELGVDYVTLHPRSAHQGFKRNANRDFFKRILHSSPLPLIYNGDIRSAADAVQLLQHIPTVMIGREAVRQPWIFKQIERDINNSEQKIEIDLNECIEEITAATYKYLPKELHKSRSHRLYGYFCSNFIFGHNLFTKIKKVDSPKKMQELIINYLNNNPHERFKLI